MKRLLLLVSFLNLWVVCVTAQSWEFLHETDHPYERIDGSCMGLDGNVYFVGRTGDSFSHSHAFIMRVAPDGDHVCRIHRVDDSYSNFRNVTQLPNGNLFAVGFRSCTSLECAGLIVVVFDTELNVILEKQYDPERSGALFGHDSQTVLDGEGNAVVFTSQKVFEAGGLWRYSAILYRFNEEGDTIMHRDFYDANAPLAYWNQNLEPHKVIFDSNTREFKYVGKGLNGLPSLEYFDNNLNFISGYQLLYHGSDTSVEICSPYASDWTTSDKETIIFGSPTHDMDSKFLFSFKADREGNIIDYSPVCRKSDTLDYSAINCCMAGVDDSTLYYFFHETTQSWGSGNLGVYRLNENLDVLGSYFHNNETPLASESVHPMPDGGCVLVADSVRGRTPVRFIKLSREDFTSIPCSVQSHTQEAFRAEVYPNPTNGIISFDICEIPDENAKIRITDIRGRLWLDCKIVGTGTTLSADVSQLKPGVYIYSIYNTQQELLKGKFVKE